MNVRKELQNVLISKIGTVFRINKPNARRVYPGLPYIIRREKRLVGISFKLEYAEESVRWCNFTTSLSLAHRKG